MAEKSSRKYIDSASDYIPPSRSRKIGQVSSHAVPRVVLSPGGRSPNRIRNGISQSPLNPKSHSVKHSEHKSQNKPKVSRKPKTTSRKVARLSKRKVYDQYDFEPVFNCYSNCMCDLEGSNNGNDGDALSQAIAKGKVNNIIEQDGSSSTHLLTCINHRPHKRPMYNPATIATDFLRAEGIHPYELALNDRFVESTRNEWR